MKRKRYDYWTKEKGPEAEYPDAMDWAVIDQQLGEALTLTLTLTPTPPQP